MPCACIIIYTQNIHSHKNINMLTVTVVWHFALWPCPMLCKSQCYKDFIFVSVVTICQGWSKHVMLFALITRTSIKTVDFLATKRCFETLKTVKMRPMSWSRNWVSWGCDMQNWPWILTLFERRLKNQKVAERFICRNLIYCFELSSMAVEPLQVTRSLFTSNNPSSKQSAEDFYEAE